MNVATFNGRRLDWRGLLALILVPLLVAGGVLAGTWRFDDHLHRVQAAVVNNDEMVEINGQKVPLGRQLSAALVDSKREQNFTWVLADEANAAAGLASGRYAAVVRIPKNFSAAATSYAGKAEDAAQATVTIETSPVAGIAETALGQSVADAAAKSVNTELTQGYLDHIYVGFNDMGKQMVTVADGAKQLADGSTKLDSGVGQASTGTKALADGLGQAADGGQQLKAGGPQLASGAKQLADGLGLMASQTKDLPTQVGAAASGAKQLADGLGTMADQTKTMPDQVNQMASGAKQLSDGAAQLDAGTPQLTSGAGQLATGASQWSSGMHTFAGGLTQYTSGVDRYVGVINTLVDQVTAVVQALPDLTSLMDSIDTIMVDLPDKAVAFDTKVQASVTQLRAYLSNADKLRAQTQTLIGQVSTAKTTVDAVASGAQTVACPASLATTPGACDAFAQGVAAGGHAAQTQLAKVDTAQAATLASEVESSRQQLLDALDQLAAASAWFKANAPQIQAQWQALRAQVPAGTSPNAALLTKLGELRSGGDQLIAAGAQLNAGASQLTDGADQLSAGASKLSTGIAQYGAGVHQLAGGMKQLSDGIALMASKLPALIDGIQQLATGSRQLSDGMALMAAGMPALVDGIQQSADGASKLSDGVGQYTDGAGKLADGIVAAHDGSVKLSDGMVQLASGSHQLSDGTTKLSDGLAEGAKQIPSYSELGRQNLAKTVASPISTTSLDGLVTPGASVASLLAVLALWLGALATYALVKPVDPRNAASSSTTGRLVLRSLLPGLAVAAVQSVVVTGLVAAFLGLAPLKALQLGGVLLVAGLAFAAVNHALAAWAGVWGRLVSLAFLVVTGVTALTFTGPAVFDALRPVSAVSPALDAAHAVLTDHTPALMVVMLAGWAVLGGLAGAYRILRSRTVSVKQLALAG